MMQTFFFVDFVEGELKKIPTFNNSAASTPITPVKTTSGNKLIYNNENLIHTNWKIKNECLYFSFFIAFLVADKLTSTEMILTYTTSEDKATGKNLILISVSKP